jgi:hypothetical protein
MELSSGRAPNCYMNATPEKSAHGERSEFEA